MKIEVGEYNCIVVKEVYGNFVLETAEGNQLAICMRDDTFEINFFNKKDKGATDNWHRVNYNKGKVEKMRGK
jgi:hypothetical protein